MRPLLTLLLLTLFSTSASAQNSEGTDFWFTFPEHRDAGNRKVALITARRATTGTITIPGTGYRSEFSVAANAVAQVMLPAAAETLGSERVTTTAVHIESAGVISLYIHQYFGFRSEATLVLPTPALGTDYRVLAYTGRSGGEVNYPSTFAVVATTDGTEISITELAAPTERGRDAQASIDVVLDRGEVYQVRAETGIDDLTGTRVTASAPVALYAGASWSGVPDNSCPAFDNLLEVNYPISQWGTRYLGVPTLRNTSNLYRILASEDGTAVTVSGGANQTFVLDAGEFRDFSAREALAIRSDKPVLAGQYLLGLSCNGHPGGLGDPSFFLLNDLTQTLDTVTVYNSNLEDIVENYLNITFRAGDEAGITLDGRPLPVPAEIGPDGEYAFARVPVSAGGHTITSSGCGVIVTVYGYGNAESYAYGGGAAFRNINANPIAEGGCLGDTVRFDTGLDTLRFRHEWTLEDGSVDTRATFPRSYDRVGNFPVRLVTEDRCLGTLDTNFREVAVTARQALEASPDLSVCAGFPVELAAFDLPDARYEWTGPNDFTEATQVVNLPSAASENEGVYAVVGNVNGCRTFPAEVVVRVDDLPAVELTRDASFCARRGETSLLDAGAFSAYQWNTGATENPIQVDAEDTYSVTVTDENGCVATDSTFVRQFCPTRFYVPSAFSPNGDGVNDVFEVYAVDFTAVRLEVYDRWGGLLFSSTGDKPAWDGCVAGALVPAGAYLYKVSVAGADEREVARTRVRGGVVLLVR
ncbi:T9SS type B sorting domain-containing protein [Neolewinella antarctica]|uniref:Gliding motility-associated-like protein n=1 Tax=Neolewinella antarctica TaxID=442734 RepID=A0ABX0XCL2_9BACT|nr:gliding motility-associated C-terminal domain-containing protein [Neolewinella antarctica]NJC27010.1 gliding motility-associated-like protein [Neolewinella antarctica]